MPVSVSTFLMFDKKAEEALDFYQSAFDDMKVGKIRRYKSDDQGPEGYVRKARFQLGGQNFICFDSPIPHEFTFTPAISIFVECHDEDEVENAFKRLAEGGEVLMPLDKYGFSSLFGWVNDKFGVSWQLNLK